MIAYETDLQLDPLSVPKKRHLWLHGASNTGKTTAVLTSFGRPNVYTFSYPTHQSQLENWVFY